MAALLGLVVGAAIALLAGASVPQEMSRYVAMAVVAAIDASFGGIRAYLEHTFSDRNFLIAFLTNAGLAMGLVWVGDQLGLDFTLPIVVVLGIRIFSNVAAIRRRVFGG